jgi:hypothetical protein
MRSLSLWKVLAISKKNRKYFARVVLEEMPACKWGPAASSRELPPTRLRNNCGTIVIWEVLLGTARVHKPLNLMNSLKNTCATSGNE